MFRKVELRVGTDSGDLFSRGVAPPCCLYPLPPPPPTFSALSLIDGPVLTLLGVAPLLSL